MLEPFSANAYLAAVLNCARDAIVSLDRHGNVVSWNPAAERMFGYSQPEIVGRTVAKILPFSSHDKLQTMIEGLRAGNHQVRELLCRRKDGSEVELEISLAAVEGGGRNLGTILMAREVSERKRVQGELKRVEESRRRLAAVVENSADAIISKDMCGIITSWNMGASAIYGYGSGEAVGRSVSMLMPHDRKHELSEIMKRIARGEPIDHYETQRQTKDGKIIDVSLSTSPILDDDGNIVGAFTISRDITERKRAEDALRNSERLAVTGRLAASIAHEINNPLESVTNLLYLLEHHPALDDNARQYVSMAGEELARIVHITRQTLGFYRESAVPVEIRLPDLLENVLQLYSRRIQTRRIRIEKRFGSQPEIMGFPGEMRQVFSNLIVNALDAVGDGGEVKLHVFQSRDWKHPQRFGVRVVIADNGPGIPPEYRKRIFEPFYTTKGERGTGLGLWVSSGIIHKYGGEIRVRSSVDPRCTGTTFSVFLPAASPLPHVKAA